MSDFLFNSNKQPSHKLTNLLKYFTNIDDDEYIEFHGDWGSISIKKNHYKKWPVYENETIILGVIGGPWLKIPVNDEKNYTKVLYEKWILENNFKWDQDISGPFTVIKINKFSNEVEFITDLLGFIPLFYSQNKTNEDQYIVGTHSDSVAFAAKRNEDIDEISIADLIINNAIVYPYTFYKSVYQVSPAAYSKIINEKFIYNNYWLPKKEYKYNNIKQTSQQLRSALLNAVNSIIGTNKEIAFFLSGGEDSRLILSSINEPINKNAFIFTDQINREAKTAKKTAEILDTKLTIKTRTKDFYPKNLESSSILLSSQYNYTQLHTIEFHKSCNLKNYNIVFGGFLADALLKLSRHKTKKIALGKSILYEAIDKNEEEKVQFIFKNTDILNQHVLKEIEQRYQNHFDKIKSYRDSEIWQWFELFPISNCEYAANFYGNRRLFNSYEPFMDNEIVKISASIPLQWKLNRKIMQKAFSPLLKKTILIPHSEKGIFPYFNWVLNIPLQIMEHFFRKFFEPKLSGNQGPWSKWDEVYTSDFITKKQINYSKNLSKIENILNNNFPVENLLSSNTLNKYQKLILTRILFNINNNLKISKTFDIGIYD